MNTQSSPFPVGTPPTEVFEVSVLLQGWQLTALEDAGRDQGLSAGQLMRRVLSDYLGRRGTMEDPLTW